MFNELKESLKKSIMYDLNMLLHRHNSEEFYAIALTTNSEFTTVRLALATVDFLRCCIKDYSFSSLEEFSGMVWNPDEWTIFSNEIPNSKLLSLHHEINIIYDESSDFEKYKKEMEKVFIDAIKELDLSKCLGMKVFKFVYDTDPSDEECLPNKSSKILNSIELNKDFTERYTNKFSFYPNIQIKNKKRLLP